jgi:hypothetical protein
MTIAEEQILHHVLFTKVSTEDPTGAIRSIVKELNDEYRFVLSAWDVEYEKATLHPLTNPRIKIIVHRCLSSIPGLEYGLFVSAYDINRKLMEEEFYDFVSPKIYTFVNIVLRSICFT